jgi:hypothetical protein
MYNLYADRLLKFGLVGDDVCSLFLVARVMVFSRRPSIQVYSAQSSFYATLFTTGYYTLSFCGTCLTLLLANPYGPPFDSSSNNQARSRKCRISLLFVSFLTCMLSAWSLFTAATLSGNLRDEFIDRVRARAVLNLTIDNVTPPWGAFPTLYDAGSGKIVGGSARYDQGNFLLGYC